MKKLLSLAGLALLFGTGAICAGTHGGYETWQEKASLYMTIATMSDSTQTRTEIEEAKEQTASKKKDVSIDELKVAAKRNNKSAKNKKVVKKQTVSYPSYPGGNVAIREFVRKQQRYPEECKSERLRGRVEVTMTISWDGTPHTPKITKSSGNEHMDAEALRIANMMPGWEPAAESDSPQDIQYTIFVNFRPGR